MFTVYLDDSGTAPEQKAAIAAAIIIPSANLEAMDHDMARLKSREGFECFHTSPCLYKNPKFGFGDWDNRKAARVYQVVCQTTRKYSVAAYSFAVNKKDYDEIVPQEYLEAIGQYHYTWAVRNVIVMLDAWRKQFSDSPLNLVFSWMDKRDPRRREVENVIAQANEMARERGTPDDFKHSNFCEVKSHSGLQCVDALAWTNYQFALKRFTGRRMYPEIASTESFLFETYRLRSWMGSYTVTRSAMQEWMDNEARDGTSLNRFLEWRARVGGTKDR